MLHMCICIILFRLFCANVERDWTVFMHMFLLTSYITHALFYFMNGNTMRNLQTTPRKTQLCEVSFFWTRPCFIKSIFVIWWVANEAIKGGLSECSPLLLLTSLPPNASLLHFTTWLSEWSHRYIWLGSFQRASSVSTRSFLNVNIIVYEHSDTVLETGRMQLLVHGQLFRDEAAQKTHPFHWWF